MKTSAIIAALRNYKMYLAELSVIENCVSNPLPMQQRYSLLKRKTMLIQSWEGLLLSDEQVVITARLIDREKWNAVNKRLAESRNIDFEYDERTLQRIQEKAVSKIATFMMSKFQDELDYLFAEDGQPVHADKNAV